MFDLFDVVLVIAAGVLIAALSRIAYDLGREDGREETIRDVAASRLRMMADWPAEDRPATRDGEPARPPYESL